MMSAWNLLWIIPLCGSFGFAIAACMTACDRVYYSGPIEEWNSEKMYNYGDLIYHRGKILRCEIPSRSYAESWDPDLYPLAWEEVNDGQGTPRN